MMIQYAIEWENKIVAKQKLCTYAKMNDTFRVENYVTMNLMHQQWSILAQLRCGVLPIKVETDQYTNTQY